MPQWKFDMSGFTTTVRSRVSVQDGLILFAALCAAALFAFEYEFFENVDHMTSRERRITVQEFFALTGLLIVGLILFSFRRLQQQKLEFSRRLVAEIAAHRSMQEAMCDPLTGLPNRRALLQALAEASLGRLGSGEPHALLLLDLTGFKAINDRYGHPVGDRLLASIAARMQSITGARNLVARLGGDEFAVICRHFADPGDVRQLAHQLVAAIEAPIDIQGIPHRVGVGTGIALFPQDAGSVPELMRCADAALYRAKAETRSAVHCYASEPAAV
jgi:diguanylate cyclase (GGDEF)-like protein